jgi:tetratricopeptide (TPR) repeat protein
MQRNAFGQFHRKITTSSELAQQEFDQGLLLCYGFNHDEAVRCFEMALQADPECAMAAFGIAYALGPNINLPLTDPTVARRAHAMAQTAQELARKQSVSPVEAALLSAMASRYSAVPPEDRSPLDRAYADAMRKTYASFPEDPDVGALYAESLLDLSPWNQWNADGSPRPNTEEVLSVLERTIAIHPDHPGALHFWIHTTEGSANPERALAAAARLPDLARGCGHLVHMPAHTYMRCGRYRDALEANLEAVEVDRAYFAKHGAQGIYHMYLAHNQHFAVYAAMFLGDSKTALRCARELVADLPAPMLQQSPEYLDAFLAMPLHVLIRFGRWKEVLNEPQAAASFPIARSLWHYARGVAFANTDRIEEARREQAEFERASAALPAGAVVGLTPAADVMAVARGMLAGEIAFRSGDAQTGVAMLRAAIAAEDALRYDEPPGWMQPVRHALGALLLESGDAAAAEAVYREDLLRHPDNGWSLHGLAECQRRLGDPTHTLTQAAFARAWRDADMELRASCFCRR